MNDKTHATMLAIDKEVWKLIVFAFGKSMVTLSNRPIALGLKLYREQQR
jgi:hypothetical protein